MAFNPTYTYNWPQIIKDLEHNRYTRKQCVEVHIAAHNWATCPAGSWADEEMLYLHGGKPKDQRLTDLACVFSYYIQKLIDTGLRGCCTMSAANAARKALRRIGVRIQELGAKRGAGIRQCGCSPIGKRQRI